VPDSRPRFPEYLHPGANLEPVSPPPIALAALPLCIEICERAETPLPGKASPVRIIFFLTSQNLTDNATDAKKQRTQKRPEQERKRDPTSSWFGAY
jgi:hypothetical protein